MKNINGSIIGIILLGLLILLTFIFPRPVKAERNLEYETYCDSIWDNNLDYYCDVLVTTDEYQDYIEQNGKWWEEDDCLTVSELIEANNFKYELIDFQEKALEIADSIFTSLKIENPKYAYYKEKCDSLIATQL